jgi:uncharacterized protein YndB with AHSA1/START domain
MEDRIEQRITIRAAQDTVWQLVTRPGWWLPGASAEPAREPGRVSVTYRGDPRPYVVDVVRVEPQGYVSFRWASAFGGAQPAPGRATMVEFYLRPVGGETGLTVVESGFTSLDLPLALREDELTGSQGGWRYELTGLRTRAESAQSERGASERGASERGASERGASERGASERAAAGRPGGARRQPAPQGSY